MQAGNNKRPFSHLETSSVESTEYVKRQKHEDIQDGGLHGFLQWCTDNGMLVSSKVYVGRAGSCAQYGMVAKENIEKGEVLFEIPRSLLFTPQSSEISQLLTDDNSSIQSESGWVPLLLALMYEYTSQNSRWHPYLSLVPDFDELDLPMFWPMSELVSELSSTGVSEAVIRDMESIESEFTNIVLPFITKHNNLFSPKCHDLHFYKQMVAFVMAYSFTEPINTDDDSDEDDDEAGDRPKDKNTPMMVPMADILNHVAKNNAHLDFGADSLKMVATKSISQGEEVFNTYGQLANGQLLHMYGFAETFPENHFDTVEISGDIFKKVFTEHKNREELKEIEKKWAYLEKIGLLTEGSSVVVGMDGILTEDEMIQTIKVLDMDKEELRALKESGGWMEDDTDCDNFDFSTDGLSSLPDEWKMFFRRLFKFCFSKYDRSPDDTQVLNDHQLLRTLTKRQRHCLNVRNGQKQILIRLLNAIES